MLQSDLYRGDPILEAIASDEIGPDGRRVRISRTQNNTHDVVEKIQTGLLYWDSNALPQFGPDGDYGSETAGAVLRFKRQYLQEPEPVYDDVGPKTVNALDLICLAQQPGPTPPPPTTYVRRDVWVLQPDATWHPHLLAYARAVRAMKQRDLSDPTSWDFQAAIHGTYSAPPPGTPTNSWHSCQHGCGFFLPWHRLYLYYFERIVRAEVIRAGGPADFALPYWNYEGGGTTAQLPWPFRLETLDDGSPNPLFVPPPGRRNSVNTGFPIIEPGEPNPPSSDIAMNYSTFVPGFGGWDIRVNHDGRSGTMYGVESSPHNPIHGRIGGSLAGALMTDPDRAALDPIFWLHHANIDRLWNRWLVNHANPANAVWGGQQFYFHDEARTLQTPAVSMTNDSAKDLGYVYDDQTEITPRTEMLMEAEAQPPELIGSTEVDLSLLGDPASINIEIPEVVRADFVERLVSASRVFLVAEDIRAPRNTGLDYGLSIVLPDMANLGETRTYPVGSISLFGIEQSNNPENQQGVPGMRHTFDITGIIQGLIEVGEGLALANLPEIEVVVAPSGLELLDEAERDIFNFSNYGVTIGQVSLYVG